MGAREAPLVCSKKQRFHPAAIVPSILVCPPAAIVPPCEMGTLLRNLKLRLQIEKLVAFAGEVQSWYSVKLYF